jgi:diguanylate cyclase (GGDEF)-like protein
MQFRDRPWTRGVALALLALIFTLLLTGLLTMQHSLESRDATVLNAMELRDTERLTANLRLALSADRAVLDEALSALTLKRPVMQRSEIALLEVMVSALKTGAVLQVQPLAERLETSLAGRFDALLADQQAQDAVQMRQLIGFSSSVAACVALMVALLIVGYQQRNALIQRLEWQASTDGLTGVLNRRAWDSGYALTLTRANRIGLSVSVVMLDLDHFKKFNDRYGHGAGDKILRLTAQALQRSTRVTDIVARYGGEEFALCLEGCTAEDAKALLERIKAKLPAGMTFSAGVTVTDGSEPPSVVLERADRTLYAAKRAGRNLVLLSSEINLKPTSATDANVMLSLKSTATT